jgi:tRNA1(Val) A37 N6-methylase TrmN6
MNISLDSIRDIRIYQFKSGYRFSVDALLLSSFVNLQRAERIADIGAGSGIIGLLLARKYPHSMVVLLELQESLASLADENVKMNNLAERVKVVRCDVRELPGGIPASLIPTACPFDLIVSNPPFRRERTGLMSAGEERSVARHEITMKLSDLAAAVRHLLKSKGRFFLIYLPERLAELAETLRKNGFEIKRLRFVHSNSCSEAKMVLVEAVKNGRAGLKVERPLCIYEGGSYSAEMEEICNGNPVIGKSCNGILHGT